MAKASRGIWAIDIGSCSLKAVKMHAGDEGLEAIGFDYLEHSRILSVPDISQEERIRVVTETLQKFLAEHDLSKDEVAVSIAGQNSFARFIKLPPVEQKKIPEIVQFEAVQQIPFDINEVEWDWQLMEVADSPDTEVGIFAIKNELIAEVMDHFTRENLQVSCVQIAPMALYNYLLYDRTDVAGAGGKATVILDMGAENTTLVICTKDSVWQRSIRIGGNTFTQAVADAFKLNFAKAEKLKRTAPMSKYMRQIFTAMKPVYTDLGGEIQRSLGFYSSSGAGRDKGFSQIIALGGGMKLQGLTKYLQQSLGLPVVKPDSFNRLSLSPELSSAKFHENVSDFGIVYGLGVQLLDEPKISINLLPRRIARAIAWTRKARLFTAAAAVLIAVSLLGLLKQMRDVRQYNSNERARGAVQAAVSKAQQMNNRLQEILGEIPTLEQQIQTEHNLFKHRDIVPLLTQTLIACLPNANNTADQKGLFAAYESGDVKAIKQTPRSERKQMFVTNITMKYATDLLTAGFPQTAVGGGFGPLGGFGPMGGGGLSEGPMEMLMPPGGGMSMDPMGGFGMEGGMGGEVSTPAGGFVVVIEGYSPFGDIRQLLDPPGVGTDQSRWGVVTRLKNLKALFSDDFPFELLEPGKIVHFKVDWGYVDLQDKEMPQGIGIYSEEVRVPAEAAGTGGLLGGAAGNFNMMGMPGGQNTRITREAVLFDPMTNEEISKIYDIYTAEEVARNPDLTDRDIGRIKFDGFGKPRFLYRDSWFRIQAKIKWKDAPAPTATDSGYPEGGMYPAGGMGGFGGMGGMGL